MARRPLLRCPKCSSKITSRVQCNNCGLLFARYSMAQDKKKAELAAKLAKNAQIKRILSLALTALLFLAIGVTGYYYLGQPKPVSQVTQSIPVQDTQNTPSQVTQNVPVLSTTPNTVQSPTEPISTAEEEQKAEANDKLTFGIAKETIVSIDTPWGACTGFFIKKNLIITSKYMVEYNSDRYEEYINEVQQSRQLLEQKAEELKEEKVSYEEMDYGTAKDELATKIDKDEVKLSNALIKQQIREDQLKDKATVIKAAEIVIYLPNGDTVEMVNLETSNTHDLALITVNETDAPSIELPPEETPLVAGDAVYSLGPGNRAIPGVFVEYHQGDKGDNTTKSNMLTDAQISPRYNGAPLIDKNGYAYGISTTKLTNEDGVGSAIPIATVFSEFSL